MRDRDFLSELCWRLGRMVVGKAATGLVPCHPAGAAVLPSWIWLPPKMDMGRKGTGLMPVRWATGLLAPSSSSPKAVLPRSPGRRWAQAGSFLDGPWCVPVSRAGMPLGGWLLVARLRLCPPPSWPPSSTSALLLVT